MQTQTSMVQSYLYFRKKNNLIFLLLKRYLKDSQKIEWCKKFLISIFFFLFYVNMWITSLIK